MAVYQTACRQLLIVWMSYPHIYMLHFCFEFPLFCIFLCIVVELLYPIFFFIYKIATDSVPVLTCIREHMYFYISYCSGYFVYQESNIPSIFIAGGLNHLFKGKVLSKIMSLCRFILEFRVIYYILSCQKSDQYEISLSYSVVNVVQNSLKNQFKLKENTCSSRIF